MAGSPARCSSKPREMSRAKSLALGTLTLSLIAGLIAVSGGLPSLEGRRTSAAFLDTSATRLGRAIVPRAAAKPGKSGIYPLLDSRDAFAARVLLAQAAERSLDVQYYIWRKDLSGTLLFDALRKAADRGVRVRLLLDDSNTSGLDTTLAALDSHPTSRFDCSTRLPSAGPGRLGISPTSFALTDACTTNRLPLTIRRR